MPDFTQGKGEAHPNRVMVKGHPLALVNGGKEADVRLMAATPEMYEAITECADTLEAIRLRDDCYEAADLYQLEELIHALWELLARIDEKEERKTKALPVLWW